MAHAKQERALSAVRVFVQLPGRTYHTRASDDVDRLRRRAHRAAAGKAEINLRSVTWPLPISVIYRRETSLPPVMRRFVEIIKAVAQTMAVGNLG
jgi:hypothetical protein